MMPPQAEPRSGAVSPIESAGERRSKIMAVTEAVEDLVQSGCSLAVGGMHMHNNPMGLVREIVRQKKRIGTLITSPSANINADMLIGANLVDELLSPYVGFEHFGISYNYRRAVESGKLKVYECDEALIMLGLRAGGAGLPFMPVPSGLELSDVPKLNTDCYRMTRDPFTGSDAMCVRALTPDVAMIHCQKADVYGNSIFEGSQFADFEMVKASENVIIMADEIVSDDYIANNPRRVGIPAFMVDAVVPMPFGCHPTASHTLYAYDEEHLLEYISLSKDDFSKYLDEYVFTPADHDEYIALIGGEKKMRELALKGRVIWGI